MSVCPDSASEGTLFFVIGPPGAGKQALIDAALHTVDHLQRAPIVVAQPKSHPRQIIGAITPEAFGVEKRDGRFLLSWDTDGTRFALPMSIESRLESGQSMIVAGEAASLREAIDRIPQIEPIYVTASQDVLRRRLMQAGRFPEHDIDRILAENLRHKPRSKAIRVIDTSKSITEGAAAMRAILGQSNVTSQVYGRYPRSA